MVYERKREFDNPEFSSISNDFVEKHAKPNKRQWKNDERLIKKYLQPKWKELRASDITRRDVISLLDDIVKNGAPIQANRVHSLISKIFNWAISRDLLDQNPCMGVKKPSKENLRDRVLSEDEIRSLWIAFRELHPHVGGIFKLMLLTAQRRWEVSHMVFLI